MPLAVTSVTFIHNLLDTLYMSGKITISFISFTILHSNHTCVIAIHDTLCVMGLFLNKKNVFNIYVFLRNLIEGGTLSYSVIGEDII